MSRIRMMVVASIVGCSSGEVEGDVEALTCDETAPIRLLDVITQDVGSSWDVYTDFTDDYIVARSVGVAGTAPDQRYIRSTDAIDRCGTSRLELEARDVDSTGMFGNVGNWLLRATTDEHDVQDVHWIDPTGLAPSHVVFERIGSCLAEVADGLAAIDVDGTLWFHADPSDPEVGSLALADDIVVPESGGVSGGFACGRRRFPMQDGDAVLVLQQDGAFRRVPAPDGVLETIIDARVADVALLDDPRYVLWLEDDGSASGEHALWAHDREEGDDVFVAMAANVHVPGRSGTWLTATAKQARGMVVSTTFIDLASGATFVLDDEWELIAQLSATRLLVEPPSDWGWDAPSRLQFPTAIIDAENGTIERIAFPAPSRFQPTYDDGVIAFEPDGTWDRGTLKRLPFAGGEVEALAYVEHPYMRLQDGTITFLEHIHDDDPTGALVVLRDGGKQVVATDVRYWTVPFYGTARERRELVYVTDGPGGPGLWRSVLP